MIQSEKELEDYICSNQEEFIDFLKRIYGKEKEIKFIGRQLKIGKENIADLIYYDEQGNCKNYYVVELKFRKVKPDDLSQISRYMTLLNEKAISNNINANIYGLFVSLGVMSNMEGIMIKQKSFGDSNIKFASIKTKLKFGIDEFSCKQEYIQNLSLDTRIKEVMGLDD